MVIIIEMRLFIFSLPNVLLPLSVSKLPGNAIDCRLDFNRWWCHILSQKDRKENSMDVDGFLAFFLLSIYGQSGNVDLGTRNQVF